MAKFRVVPDRIAPTRSRIPIIQLPEEERFSPDLVERKRLYTSQRWRELRSRELRRNPKCFFCGAPSEVLEHIVGHGEDAMEVAQVLRLPGVSPDWRERFWRGPFCGTCKKCAASRSGAERVHRLAVWTRQWMEARRKV